MIIRFFYFSFHQNNESPRTPVVNHSLSGDNTPPLGLYSRAYKKSIIHVCLPSPSSPLLPPLPPLSSPPKGTMGEDGWRPAAPLYDFLSVMDHEAPGYARPSSPRVKTGEGEEGGGREGGGGEREAQPSRPPWHSEL